MSNYKDELISLIDLTQDKPLNEIIYEGLRSAIIKGVIPIGERINEKNLALALNVSRTPVREAMRRIQDEEIVNYTPNYGITVAQFTKEDVEEIYKIRLSLDLLAGENAAQLMTEEKEIRMEKLLKETELAQKEGRIDDVIEMSKQFNSLIYEFSEMPRLTTIQHRLIDYVVRFRDISLTANERRALAIAEHREIFELMKAGKVEEMKDLMTTHLNRSKEFISITMQSVYDNEK